MMKAAAGAGRYYRGTTDKGGRGEGKAAPIFLIKKYLIYFLIVIFGFRTQPAHNRPIAPAFTWEAHRQVQEESQ
jgi:hypothetical protein